MRLKQTRKEKKLTQEEVANMLNFPKTTYSNYEQERRTPDINTLIKLADFYGVSLDYLCGHETPKQLDLPPLNKDQITAIQMLVKLNQQNFTKAFSYISGLYVEQ